MRAFLDTKRAARLLSLSPRTLEKLRSTGSGPPYHKVLRRVLYSVSDLEQWVEAHGRDRTRGRAPAQPVANAGTEASGVER